MGGKLAAGRMSAGGGKQRAGLGQSARLPCGTTVDRLAELDETRVETDTGLVLKSAGAFVGLLILLGVVAVTSGVVKQY